MKKFRKQWKQFEEFLKSQKFFGVRADDILFKLLYVLVLAGVIFWMLPSERPFEYSHLTVNSIAPEEIIAPFKFAIQKTPEELKREREQARANVPLVFDKNPDTANRQRIQLASFFEKLAEFYARSEWSGSLPGARQRASREAAEAAIDTFLQQVNLKYAVKLDRTLLQQLYVLHTQKNLNQLAKNLDRALTQVYQQGIINRPKAEIPEKELVLSEGGIEEKIAPREVLEIAEAQAKIKTFLKTQYPPEAPEIAIADYLVAGFLAPNLIYNEEITRERKENAIHDVPLTRGYVEQDERIVDNNEKITEEVYQKLQSLSIALKERSALQSGWQQFKFNIGKALYAIILLFIIVLYLYFYRRAVFSDNRLLGMITLIILMQFGLVEIIEKFIDRPHLVIPVVLVPMLLGMLLDFGIGFIGMVSLSLIFGAVKGNDYMLTLMMLTVGAVALFSVQNIRKRGQMYRAIVYIMGAYLAISFIDGFLHFRPMKDILNGYAFYLVDAIIVPMIVFLLIGIFERLFDVTTNLTLLELSDLNHPLLKRLSVRAPGSFHHSIVVANLGEAAAEAIGANALLTRVGCYFHDIGKMLKPEYFVENQMGGVNKHDPLSPHMSALILANHVKEGLKLAERHNLPRAVKQFIPEHHGTSLMTFFYHKFLESSDDKDVDESNFHYPGPKPQSRETAIAMLADVVEAATRALNNPTPPRIRNLVDTLVEKKIEEGELDDCDLTLKEIKQIKEAFLPILAGIHHGRIEYPGSEAEKEKKPVKEKSSASSRGNSAAEPPGAEKERRAGEANGKNRHAPTN